MEIWDSKWRVGFSMGSFVEIPINGALNLRTGIRFVRLGSQFHFDTGEGSTGGRHSGDFKIFQDYLTLPLLAKINVSKYPRLFIMAGPEAGLLVSASATLSETISFAAPFYNQERLTDEKIYDNMAPYNFCLNTGCGIEFLMLAHLISIQLEYSHGLVGTAKESKWFSNWKTREVKTSIAYKF
jgi:hypothetical protein